MKTIREEMKKLQASNGEILALLKRDCNGEWWVHLLVPCKTHRHHQTCGQAAQVY
jgi:hypothetical protein